MAIRSRVNRKRDRGIFKHTAVKKHVKNLPGHLNSRRGGAL